MTLDCYKISLYLLILVNHYTNIILYVGLTLTMNNKIVISKYFII